LNLLQKSQPITPLSTARWLIEHDLFAFESRTLAALLGLEISRVSHLLARMERDGLVARLERGKYVLLGLNPEQTLSNPLFLGGQFVTPSYVSFWSALHFYGFTEQAPRQVFIAVTRAKRPLIWRGTAFRFVRLQPRAFFGYRRETLGGLPVTVADEAKAIVDSLLLPQYAGGVSEAAKALRSALQDGYLSAADLIDYARRMGNASLEARLGYLLEALGQPTNGLTPPAGPVRLEPRRPAPGGLRPSLAALPQRPTPGAFPSRSWLRC
jgi:predicted transcriptional regulator of viral defense system